MLEENIRARVSAILKDIGHAKPWELEWWSVLLREHAVPRRLPAWPCVLHRRCRAFVPTRRARLNNGLADAENLGWKLAAVPNGADERLLDSYSPERRGARWMCSPCHQ